MADLKIDVYCNDGSPIGIDWRHIYEGLGIGGAELALFTWAEFMARRGHQVRIYNDPAEPGTYQGIEFLSQNKFDPSENRDVFIAWRSPNRFIQKARGYRIHWSTDQYTSGNFATDIVPYVDKIVCISPFHRKYYLERYGPPETKIVYLDLGVRLEDYTMQPKKVACRCIFCSVPDRGLQLVPNIWSVIKEAVPDASLVITSDYRLWGSQNPLNYQHRLNMVGQEGTVYLGAIPRPRLIALQSEAQVHLYPCTYDELFCISAAECQVAGAYPVTSAMGALETTNEFGITFTGHPESPAWQKEYTATVIELLLNQESLTARAEACMERARVRFSWDKICDKWEKMLNGSAGSPQGGAAADSPARKRVTKKVKVV